MELLDRADALAALTTARERAAAGDGRIVVVRGETGIGKTTLIRHLRALQPPGTEVLLGACDDLVTPRPLAPFHDIARQLGGRVADLVAQGAGRDLVHDAMLDVLNRLPPPIVMILEDLHWADEATLDLVLTMGRRLVDRPVLLVTTHRADEVDAGHPLTRVLARLPTANLVVVDLGPLSLGAVSRLATQTAIDGAELHRVTGGNPFYVTEVLAGEELAPSASVSVAVTDRVARLPVATRRLLDLMSIVPARVGVALLNRCEPHWPELLEPAEQRGIVTVAGDAVVFRHELARRAIEQSLPSLRARRLHGQVLRVLEELQADASRLVHHADGAGDVAAIVTHAPVAARIAQAADAHREAVAHYLRALRHEERFTPEERGAMYRELAGAGMAADQPTVAVSSARRAVEVFRAAGDDVATGEALTLLSRLASWASDLATARTAAREAIDVLEPRGPTALLARAYGAMCYVALTEWDGPAARTWADRCEATARAVGDEAVAALGRVYRGALHLSTTGSETDLRAAMAVVERHGEHQTLTQAYMVGSTALHFRREYRRANAWISEAMAHGVRHEHLGWLPYFHSLRALLNLDVGAWDEVEPEVDGALARHTEGVWAHAVALTARGRLASRTGRPGALADLQRAWQMASELGVLQLRYPAAVALTELLWLQGKLDGVPPELAEIRAPALETGWSGALAEIGVWLQRAGAGDIPIDAMSGPFRLLLEGRHLEAAQAWERLGCPYERAEALVLSDDVDALLAGLAILDDLGALPLAQRTRTRLRALGVSGVPRGPRQETRQNPARLTPRQAEVLAVLVEGLTNAQIAERLFLSTRTVDHHVAALLAKLEAGSRGEAVERARQLGLVGLPDTAR
jgi:DNA-binding CsgD family transcriptional regulator/energy-coupling factor transporter ATP-binding protein EcfA2